MGIPWLGVIGSTHSEGVVLVWTCPTCQESRDLHLVISVTDVVLMPLPLPSSSGEMLALHCPACGNGLRVVPEEKEGVLEVAKLTAQLRAGKLNEEAYREAVKGTNYQFVRHLVALTETWKCETCGEENPINFDACWKCSGQADAQQEPLDSEDESPLPGSGSPGLPWDRQ